MPRLASDAVGGKSGQSHPTSRRDPIHIGRMTRNAYVRVGWYGEGVLFITTPFERQLHCTRAAPDRPTTSRWSPDDAPTADAGSGTHSHWPSRQHWGTIGASDQLTWSGHSGLQGHTTSHVTSSYPYPAMFPCQQHWLRWRDSTDCHQQHASHHPSQQKFWERDTQHSLGGLATGTSEQEQIPIAYNRMYCTQTKDSEENHAVATTTTSWQSTGDCLNSKSIIV